MQKWWLLVLLSVGLVACQDSNNTTNDETNQEVNTVITEDVVDENASAGVSGADTTQNSVDTVGVYLIQTPQLTASLSLDDDGTFEFEGLRDNEQFKYAGQYTWLPDGRRISLGDSAKNVQFFMGENVAVYLGENPEGKNKYTEIQGNPEFAKSMD